MTIFIGAERIGGEAAAEDKPKKGGRPTKAELLEEAASLGIEVPAGATNPEIAGLIREAKAGA